MYKNHVERIGFLGSQERTEWHSVFANPPIEPTAAWATAATLQAVIDTA